MPPTDRSLIQAAARAARAETRDALARRDAALERRRRAIAAHPAPAVAPPSPRSRGARATSLDGPPAVGYLIAEGDSWFDYPGDDILSILSDDYGYDVRSVAHAGDRVEAMAYEGGQLDRFLRTLESLLRDGHVPTAILLSGGGNDIAGDEFALLLDHAQSPTPGLNEAIVRGVIDQRLLASYARIVTRLTEACRAYIGRPVPIVVHGYDYPVPDGRGFGILSGWGPFPGPWLEPGFAAKGYPEMSDRLPIMRTLIDRFNAMLATLAAQPEHSHVRYVNLRETLQQAPYKRWWANELHPTRRGFTLIARAFAERIAAPIATAAPRRSAATKRRTKAAARR